MDWRDTRNRGTRRRRVEIEYWFAAILAVAAFAPAIVAAIKWL